MSYRRKVRSAHSMYHPGISLSREPTYNQKKGMILTRNTNLPDPSVNVVSTQSLYNDARRLLKTGTIKHKDFVVNMELDIGDSATLTFDSSNLITECKGKFGPNIEVLECTLMDFSLNVPSGYGWPDVNYTIHIGDVDFRVPSYTDSNASPASFLQFDIPYIYPYSSSDYRLYCPRLFLKQNYSSPSQWATVKEYYATATGLSDLLKNIYSAGYSHVPYAYVGDSFPVPVSTSITVDSTYLTQKPILRTSISCTYIRK